MIDILDFHTHRPDATRAIISVDPRQFDPQPGQWYSVGFHPWYEVDRLDDNDYRLLEQCAQHPQVLAIGETGMDSKRGADLNIQATVFVRHLRLAASLSKPVIVHQVKTAQRILDQRHKAGLDQVPLVVHGMRNGEHVARLLLDAGCFLSYGPHYTPASLIATPPDRLLLETDDAPVTIDEVTAQVAATLQKTTLDISRLTAANAQRLIHSGSH